MRRAGVSESVQATAPNTCQNLCVSSEGACSNVKGYLTGGVMQSEFARILHFGQDV